jgi:hypothetical protein
MTTRAAAAARRQWQAIFHQPILFQLLLLATFPTISNAASNGYLKRSDPSNIVVP